MTSGSEAFGLPGHVINVTFHAVEPFRRRLDASEAAVSASTEDLEEILNEASHHERIRIMFDDGNVSDTEVALPALLERGLRATFFLVAGRLGEPGFVAAADVRALVDAGMDVGLHGMKHRPWRRLCAADAHEELVVAREVLQEVTQRPIDSVACPFGAYDRKLLRRLAALGYRRVYTSDGGWAQEDDWLQSRTSVRRGEGANFIQRVVDEGPQSRLSRAKLAVKRWR